jgi:hypothetical protein
VDFLFVTGSSVAGLIFSNMQHKLLDNNALFFSKDRRIMFFYQDLTALIQIVYDIKHGI